MPTLHDVPEVAQLLAAVLTAEPVTHGALAVIPLLAPNLDDPDWLTLEEAGDHVRVTEVSEAGTVPFLKVVNEADQPLLLLDGEELVGAKQNRILNTTVLVAAHAEVIIPVSCVEQGRWGYRGRQFRPSDASLFASIRARKAARVSQSLRAGRGHVADQGEVWAQLSMRASELDVNSPTGAMRDLYTSHESDLAAARQALAPQPGQAGAIIYIANRWVGLDVLAGPRLFGRAWPRLCAGYVADAIGRKPEPWQRLDAGAVLTELNGSQAERAPAVGLGDEYRLGAAPGLAGATLVAEQRVAHLTAFPGIAGASEGLDSPHVNQ
jgi:ARG/rhodanese/phosphatase superfamily protein